jgi:hypothetical protein
MPRKPLQLSPRRFKYLFTRSRSLACHKNGQPQFFLSRRLDRALFCAGLSGRQFFMQRCPSPSINGNSPSYIASARFTLKIRETNHLGLLSRPLPDIFDRTPPLHGAWPRLAT